MLPCWCLQWCWRYPNEPWLRAGGREGFVAGGNPARPAPAAPTSSSTKWEKARSSGGYFFPFNGEDPLMGNMFTAGGEGRKCPTVPSQFPNCFCALGPWADPSIAAPVRNEVLPWEKTHSSYQLTIPPGGGDSESVGAVVTQLRWEVRGSERAVGGQALCMGHCCPLQTLAIHTEPDSEPLEVNEKTLRDVNGFWAEPSVCKAAPHPLELSSTVSIRST